MIVSRYFEHHLRTPESFSSATILCGEAGALKQDTLTAPRGASREQVSSYGFIWPLLWKVTDGLRDPKKKKKNVGRASESNHKQCDPTTHTELCLGQECSGIFTVKKDKMDVFKEGVVFIFFQDVTK